ncbi:uncharacterized protein PV09_06852 [Verruconis gallopava]|uniref:Uncharacterized protein n=1 Tax=Verruconis gallopava TaxID=253628 RepID=A0A0D2A4F6_9PEZI|nr:uncharacterized protein PV09_06852 [Verruconis gallopava]KIW01668.1 hypothetical protein PV09_06852 [Verruconis gallopava]
MGGARRGEFAEVVGWMSWEQAGQPDRGREREHQRQRQHALLCVRGCVLLGASASACGAHQPHRTPGHCCARQTMQSADQSRPSSGSARPRLLTAAQLPSLAQRLRKKRPRQTRPGRAKDKNIMERQKRGFETRVERCSFGKQARPKTTKLPKKRRS